MKILESKSGNGCLILGGGMQYYHMSSDDVKMYFNHDVFTKNYIHSGRTPTQNREDGCVVIFEHLVGNNINFTVVEISLELFNDFLLTPHKDYGDNKLMVDFNHVEKGTG